MSRDYRKESTTTVILKILLWVIVLPISAIYCYKNGLYLLSNILAVMALLLGWLDVVENKW